MPRALPISTPGKSRELSPYRQAHKHASGRLQTPFSMLQANAGVVNAELRKKT